MQVRPEGVEEDMLNATLLENPLNPVTVIVEFPSAPTLMADGVTGPAAIEKSTTLTFMSTEYLRDPLVAVIVSV